MRGDAVESNVRRHQSFHQKEMVHARVGEGDLQFGADHIDLINAVVGFEDGHSALQLVLGLGGELDGDDRMGAGHGHQLIDGAADDQFAALDDSELVTEFAQLGEDVAGDHDGFAEALKLLEEFANLNSGARVQAGGGFVKKENRPDV